MVPAIDDLLHPQGFLDLDLRDQLVRFVAAATGQVGTVGFGGGGGGGGGGGDSFCDEDSPLTMSVRLLIGWLNAGVDIPGVIRTKNNKSTPNLVPRRLNLWVCPVIEVTCSGKFIVDIVHLGKQAQTVLTIYTGTCSPGR